MRLDGKTAIGTGAADWNLERRDAAIAGIEAAGGKITGSQDDISERAHAEGLIDLAVSTYSGIDVDEQMYTSRVAVRHMLEHGGGEIVTIASTAGISGAAASAAERFARRLLGKLGVTVEWRRATLYAHHLAC